MTGYILPSSEGSYTEWTPSAGTTHYTVVDESTCNGVTDYNYTDTLGTRDSYGVNLALVPNGSMITAVAITPCASRNSALGEGSSVMKVFYRFNGINSAFAGNYSLTGTTPVNLTTATFSGLSHVKGPSSDLQIGTIYASGDRGARLSRVAVRVTFTPLNKPSNLHVANVSSSENSLTWQDSSTIEGGFANEKSVNNPSGPFVQIATTPANVTSMSDMGLAADQTYYYRVRAFNTGGNSRYSNTDYGVTTTVAPVAPSDLSATAIVAAGNIPVALLYWTDNSLDENTFVIERSVDNVNFSPLAVTDKDKTDYGDFNPSSGSYYYRVYASNAVGNSGYSNTASVTIP
ncbi:MAG: fibronectin type III domain-containing protein [bacterium]|nr:fibronectin type III domain-containing protein [bacterium]